VKLHVASKDLKANLDKHKPRHSLLVLSSSQGASRIPFKVPRSERGPARNQRNWTIGSC
jgi:hypothetical protein